MLYGDVYKLEYENCDFIIFNADGNVVSGKYGQYLFENVYSGTDKYTQGGTLKYDIKYTGNKRIEYITLENLCTTYVFDEKGRLIEMDSSIKLYVPLIRKRK